jgi:hypothetical protein
MLISFASQSKSTKKRDVSRNLDSKSLKTWHTRKVDDSLAEAGDSLGAEPEAANKCLLSPLRNKEHISYQSLKIESLFFLFF